MPIFSRPRHPATLLALGLIAGLILAPLSAQAGGSIGKLFNQLKPKMDQRYVIAAQEGYAYVDPATPSLVVGRTKGFSAIARVGTGEYCLTPKASLGNIDDRIFLTSPEYQSSSGSKGDVFWLNTTNNGSCAQGLVEIETYIDGTASNNIAFSVYTPVP